MRNLAAAVAASCVLFGQAVAAQAPNTAKYETTVNATVVSVDHAQRTVVFQTPGGVPQTVVVDRSVTALDGLAAGDVVTMRYVESVVVQVRPDAPPMGFKDTTADARKAGEPGVLQQLTLIVTVESIDPQGLTVTYKTQDGRSVLRAVREKRLLEGLKPGDRVEITQTQARAVSITRGHPFGGT